MTKGIITVDPETSIYNVQEIMKKNNSEGFRLKKGKLGVTQLVSKSLK